jgi:hypothetical protein
MSATTPPTPGLEAMFARLASPPGPPPRRSFTSPVSVHGCEDPAEISTAYRDGAAVLHVADALMLHVTPESAEWLRAVSAAAAELAAWAEDRARVEPAGAELAMDPHPAPCRVPASPDCVCTGGTQ